MRWRRLQQEVRSSRSSPRHLWHRELPAPTYNAQNIGAGKLERVREGFRASHFIGIVYSVVVGGFLLFAGKYFAYLFISDNIGEVLPMVAIYVKCVALFFIPLYFVNVLRNGIQGMGYWPSSYDGRCG